MRKYLIAAVAALATSATAAVAIGQQPTPAKDGVVTGQFMDASVTPTDAGTKKKPKSATVRVDIVTDPDHEPSVDKFTYQFPSTLKVSTTGFKYCTAQFLSEKQDDAGCPKGSKVGSGTAQARLGSRNADPLVFNVTIYANKGGMTLWLETVGALDIRRAIPIEIDPSSDDDFSQDLIADIPPDVEQAGGVNVVLESVSVSLSGSRKVVKRVKVNGRRVKRTFRYYVVASRGCPTNKQQTLGTVLTYKAPAGQQPTAARAVDACTA